MNVINMPGFSAEASLYGTSWNYAGDVTERAETVRLAQFDDGVPLPPSPCIRCIQRCRRVCSRSTRPIPNCFQICLEGNCFDPCGGIP
jgi:hypothetical protein